MKFFREAWKGIVFILILFALNGLFWLTATPIYPQPIESTIAQIMGANIILGFTIVFFLSTKNRFVNKWFNGLENVYITHRVLAMLSLLLIFVHSQTTSFIFQYYRSEIPFNAADMGILARNLFIGLIVIALLAKYLKYEHWRLIHRLMVIPYIFAVYHAFFISSYALISFTVLGVWMMGLAVVGVSSSVYMILLYRRMAFKYKGLVQSITPMAKNVTEIEVKMDQPYPYKTGQFAFIKIDQPPFKGVPHPFSISGKKEDSVFFTIKALGDYTQDLQEHLNVNTKISLTVPYGHMTFDDYTSPQVWIAGGIGITPFLSHLRSTTSPTQNITLYYSVRNKEEAVHLDYFSNLAKTLDNFTFHYSESEKDGYLSLKKINLDNEPSVFMCGPLPMAKALKKEFRKTDQHKILVYEAFSFTGTLVEDLVNFTKRILKR